MNTRNRFMVAMASVMMPFALMAQENLTKAMDKFISGKASSYISTDAYSLRSHDGGEVSTYSYSYKFDMPEDMKSEVDNIIKAFNKDVNKAYKVMMRTAGSDSREQMNLAYGENFEKSVIYGYYNTRNYTVMLFRDAKDSLKRYAYALSWYKEKKRIKGTFQKIYGNDPARVKEKKKKTTITYNLFRSGLVGDVYLGLIEKAKEELEMIKESLMEQGAFDEKSFEETKQALEEAKENLRQVEISFRDNSSAKEKIETSTDFLVRFGNLRSIYLTGLKEGEVDNVTLNTGIVNKIVELCKNYSYLLETVQERQVCRNGIIEMQKQSVDKYLIDLLDVAKSYLDDSNTKNGKPSTAKKGGK